MTDIEKEERAERRVWYQNQTNDLRAYKNHQWLIVYYFSLVYVGIIGFAKLRDIGGIGAFFLIVLSVIVFGLSIYFIFKYQTATMSCRKWTLTIEKTFLIKNEMQPKLYTKKKNGEYEYGYYLTYWYQSWQLIPMLIALVIGLSLAVFFLLKFIREFCVINFLNDIFVDYQKAFIIFIIIISFLIGLCLIISKKVIYKNGIKKLKDLHFYNDKTINHHE